ncbi:MAG: hypothetical protein ACREP9_00940, partial [Candidatus Dormibacteraceae bacterium]
MGSVAPDANVVYIPGNCNSEIETICEKIPRGSPGNGVLSMCVVDPFDFGIKFATLRRLSKVFVDFVVL